MAEGGEEHPFQDGGDWAWVQNKEGYSFLKEIGISYAGEESIFSGLKAKDRVGWNYVLFCLIAQFLLIERKLFNCVAEERVKEGEEPHHSFSERRGKSCPTNSNIEGVRVLSVEDARGSNSINRLGVNHHLLSKGRKTKRYL